MCCGSHGGGELRAEMGFTSVSHIVNVIWAAKCHLLPFPKVFSAAPAPGAQQSPVSSPEHTGPSCSAQGARSGQEPQSPSLTAS